MPRQFNGAAARRPASASRGYIVERLGRRACKSSTSAPTRNISASASALNMPAPFPVRSIATGPTTSALTAASSRRHNCAQEFAALGLDPQSEIIPYCQGGYRSANAYIALRLAGYPRVRNYLGSWGEWGNRDELPIEHPRRKAEGQARSRLMARAILLTGFEPFGGERTNPSWEVASWLDGKEIGGATIHTLELPVRCRRAVEA